MVKNCVGGKGAKSKARKVVNSESKEEELSELVKVQGLQCYAFVSKNCGGNRLIVECDDGTQRAAFTRGKMRTRMRICPGQFILVTLRSYEADKCDIVRVYTDNDLRRLLHAKELSPTFYHSWRTSSTKSSSVVEELDSSDADGFIFAEEEDEEEDEDEHKKGKVSASTIEDEDEDDDEEEDDDYGIEKNINHSRPVKREQIIEHDHDEDEERDDDDDLANGDSMQRSVLQKQQAKLSTLLLASKNQRTNLNASEIVKKKIHERQKDMVRKTASVYRNTHMHDDD
jgi:translation initiation factor 1A